MSDLTGLVSDFHDAVRCCAIHGDKEAFGEEVEATKDALLAAVLAAQNEAKEMTLMYRSLETKAYSYCKKIESQAKHISELESSLSDATEAQQVLGLKLAQVEAERDALKVDAGRYRFLRDAVEPPHGVSKADVIYLQHLHGAELDAAIDAAKEQQ